MPNTPQNVGSCEGCRYAQPVVTANENIILECYRYPPQMLVLDEQIVQAHPDAVYRCGEYRQSAETLLDGLADSLRKHREERENARRLGDGHE